MCRHFLFFRTDPHDWRDNLCRRHACHIFHRRARFLGDGRFHRDGYDYSSRANHEKNCAQLRTTRAGARRRWCVVDIDIADCQQSFWFPWADRTPSMAAPHAVFVKARPRVIYRGYRHKSVHRPASARVGQKTARTASTIATSPQSFVHTCYCAMRNCAIAQLPN